jgi:hypothetical protein
MKQIIKMAFLEGITIKEARERFNSFPSSAARRGHHVPPGPQVNPTTHANSSQEITSLQDQVKVLQQEVKTLKEISIPKLQSETLTIAMDLAATKAIVRNFGKKLDGIATSQATVATQQADRFDNIELLLNKLTTALTPAHLNHRQANLNSTAPQLSPTPTTSYLKDQWDDHLLNSKNPWDNTSGEIHDPND